MNEKEKPPLTQPPATFNKRAATYRSIKTLKDKHLDPEGKPSLLSMLAFHPDIHEAVEKMPVSYLEVSELELERQIRHTEGGKFPRVFALLKIAFWDEYRRAEMQKTSMRMENVCWGICHRQYWEKHVIEKPQVLAWLIKPPTSEIVIQKEMLDLGYKKLRQTLTQSIFKMASKKVIDPESGKVIVAYEKVVNVGLVKEIHAIVKTLQDRLHGTAIQRSAIEQKSLNVNVEATSSKTGTAADEIVLDGTNFTADELDEMEGKLQAIQETILKAEAKRLHGKPESQDGVHIEVEALIEKS